MDEEEQKAAAEYLTDESRGLEAIHADVSLWKLSDLGAFYEQDPDHVAAYEAITDFDYRTVVSKGLVHVGGMFFNSNRYSMFLIVFTEWGRQLYHRECYFAERIDEMDDTELRERAELWKVQLAAKKASPDGDIADPDAEEGTRRRARKDTKDRPDDGVGRLFDWSTNELVNTKIVDDITLIIRTALVDGVRYDPKQFNGRDLPEPGTEGSGGGKRTKDEKELCNRIGMAVSSVNHFLSRT